MDVLAKQVNDLLKNQYELGFQYDEEKAEFYFSIDMNHVCLDVRIICREADKQVLMFAYVPIKIQESQYSAVLRLINKIQMDNFDSVSLFINENCNQLMSQSALNVGADFRIDEEVFRFAFYPLVSALDDHFIEFIRIISAGDEEQVPDLDLSELLSLSEQNDPEAQYQNMVDMFSDLRNNPENIYVKEYVYPTSTHAYDSYNLPLSFKAPLNCGVCPTADFVELFDGFDRYPDGTLKVTTGNSCTEGNYVMYDSPMDYYKNAEPRLRAYVIFPGDVFKGKEIEIYAGVYTGAAPVKPLLSDYSYGAATTKYNHLSAYKEKPKTLYLSPKPEDQQEIVTLPDGSTMKAAGQNGPFYEDGGSAMTGLLARKWLNPDPAFVPREGNSAQPFILMRYAEVLLNAAEAAVELSLAGVSSPDGTDMLSVATKAINDIRERAGARLLTASLTGTTDSRDIVRKERRKELAFEHKTKWDLRRWRVNHYEGRDGFWGEQRNKDRFSNTTRYRFRGIYPFYSTATGKWFFDVCFNYTTAGDKDFGYTPVDYYFSIPGGEVSKSPVIDQQPNR